MKMPHRVKYGYTWNVCMKEINIDILLEKAEFALYCDFCRILQVIQWNV